MKELCFIILGSSGSLGSSVVNSIRNQYPNSELYCYDKKKSDNPNLIYCDFSNDTEIERAVSKINFSSSTRYIILSAIGSYLGKHSKDALLDWDEISDSIQINLIGVSKFIILSTKSIIKQNSFLRVVLVSSAASKVGSSDLGYGISKAGLDGFVRSFSKRLAHGKITCIGISPGIFHSSMSANQSKERQAQAINSTHTKKITPLDDVVNICLFAMLNAPDSLTGTFISPNGGQV